MRLSASLLSAVGFLLLALAPALGADDALVKAVREIAPNVVAADGDQARQLRGMVAADARDRLLEANQRDRKEWQEVKGREAWEAFRDVRIKALRESLGTFPEPPADLHVRVTRTLDGDGFQVENVVFESRPGVLLTANLYSPKPARESMPGFVICPSHHNPKTQGELQDMGMTWARAGCLVLVVDNLGHGERRQHPFKDEASYPAPFKVGRQDYFFRYNLGMQLQLVGDSLIGWMAWDLSRGVDLLLSRPGVDKTRIALLGSVAGGGDPAAVAAALDPRIAVVVPFNFGGPQPETAYPLPEGAEATFNYAGGGSWESTRNLRLSARDGFLPWVIVGAAAPRGLIYGHEFSWDADHDPVWARLRQIYAWYDAADRLAAAHGSGSVSGKPPESTHCNNIGPPHRAEMYPSLNRWLKLSVTPETEYHQRRPADDLRCLTGEVGAAIKPRPLTEQLTALADERLTAARKELAAVAAPAERAARLRAGWAKVLGLAVPSTPLKVADAKSDRVGDVTVERTLLEVDHGVTVPLLLLLPKHDNAKIPVVVAIAQDGKAGFLKHRPEVIADLLAQGVAVCLPDLRGTGESRPGDGRGRNSAATSVAASELMLGRTMLGLRLSDLQRVVRYLRDRQDVDGDKVALWGDSFAAPNVPDRRVEVPHDADNPPEISEPLGGLLAFLGGLFDDRIAAVYARGGLVSYADLLARPFCHFPHDVVVPRVLTVGDVPDVVAALAPRPVRVDALVNGLNRKAAAEEVAKTYAAAREAYNRGKANSALEMHQEPDREGPPAAWLASHLGKK